MLLYVSGTEKSKADQGSWLTDMNSKATRIDLVKLAIYVLKRCWILLICAVIGFSFMYWRTASRHRVTYTASGTMYIVNQNPNLVNYGYTSTSDLNSALKLLDTYRVVVKSDKVLEAVVTELNLKYPGQYSGITTSYIAGTLSMSSVNETGVVRVSCVTNDPQKSADICNAVMHEAPSEIVRVVGAGSAEVIDEAKVPSGPDAFSPMRRAVTGALAGAAAAAAVLIVLFLLNHKISDTQELKDNYTPPILASVKREKGEEEDPGKFILDRTKSGMDQVENYAKLRMNLLFTLAGKEKHVVAVTSAISGEGKSTIAANLAISCAMSGKKVLLIDADMRRASQSEIFHFSKHYKGLSNVLIGESPWQDVVLVSSKHENFDILPAGRMPPNPAELLGSDMMRKLLDELLAVYDLVLLDAPPINIVSDPLALSDLTAGSLFVVRQDFSDHQEVRKALTSAELTGMNILGFVFYGEKIHQGKYYYRRYYKSYYHKYDTRSQSSQTESTNSEGVN